MTSDKYQALIVRQSGHIVTVQLNRPEKRNAINSQMLAEITAVVHELRCADPGAIRAVVLTGSNTFFSTGADLGAVDLDQLSQLNEAPSYAEEANGDPTVLLETLPMPTVAAIEGWCLGGGLMLAQCCDLRIAGADSVFGLPEVKRGLPPAGVIARLIRQVGPTFGKEMMLTGDRYNAEVMKDHGFLNSVVPSGTALQCAIEWAERLSRLAPLALREIKTLAWQTSDTTIPRAVALEIRRAGVLVSTEDVREGIAAFLERREAKFSGR
jgi:enoyl-CoA hydratase